jgi:hypothetical protein
MQEKKQELEHLLALRQLASHLQTHFDELSEKFDGLMQGNQGMPLQTQKQHSQDYPPLSSRSTITKQQG